MDSAGRGGCATVSYSQRCRGVPYLPRIAGRVLGGRNVCDRDHGFSGSVDFLAAAVRGGDSFFDSSGDNWAYRGQKWRDVLTESLVCELRQQSVRRPTKG